MVVETETLLSPKNPPYKDWVSLLILEINITSHSTEKRTWKILNKKTFLVRLFLIVEDILSYTHTQWVWMVVEMRKIQAININTTGVVHLITFFLCVFISISNDKLSVGNNDHLLYDISSDAYWWMRHTEYYHSPIHWFTDYVTLI